MGQYTLKQEKAEIYKCCRGLESKWGISVASVVNKEKLVATLNVKNAHEVMESKDPA
jgi:hypothetical protein